MSTSPDIERKVAQFQDLVRQEPASDTAHFGLGQALASAGRHRDAATSFERAIALNPQFSKAYQLAAEQYLALGDRDRAMPLLKQGYETATELGDLMPKRAIQGLLEGLGEKVPEVSAAPEPVAGDFVCRKSKRPGTKMDKPPFKGPIGAWIGQNISNETWQLWIRQGTKVINELRLDLSRDDHGEQYDKHMREYLGIDDALYEQLTGRKPAGV